MKHRERHAAPTDLEFLPRAKDQRDTQPATSSSSPTKPRPAREPARAHRRCRNRHRPESPATAYILGPTRAPALRARGRGYAAEDRTETVARQQARRGTSNRLRDETCRASGQTTSPRRARRPRLTSQLRQRQPDPPTTNPQEEDADPLALSRTPRAATPAGAETPPSPRRSIGAGA